jgi:hypothetical protein
VGDREKNLNLAQHMFKEFNHGFGHVACGRKRNTHVLLVVNLCRNKLSLRHTQMVG